MTIGFQLDAQEVLKLKWIVLGIIACIFALFPKLKQKFYKSINSNLITIPGETFLRKWLAVGISTFFSLLFIIAGFSCLFGGEQLTGFVVFGIGTLLLMPLYKKIKTRSQLQESTLIQKSHSLSNSSSLINKKGMIVIIFLIAASAIAYKELSGKNFYGEEIFLKLRTGMDADAVAEELETELYSLNEMNRYIKENQIELLNGIDVKFKKIEKIKDIKIPIRANNLFTERYAVYTVLNHHAVLRFGFFKAGLFKISVLFFNMPSNEIQEITDLIARKSKGKFKYKSEIVDDYNMLSSLNLEKGALKLVTLEKGVVNGYILYTNDHIYLWQFENSHDVLKDKIFQKSNPF